MGQMVDGVWHSDEDLAHAKDGHFARPPTRFRGTIAPGGPHPPEADRYHLYVSLACPWAHRALIVRKLKGLDEMIGLSVTHWLMREDGWTFAPGPGVVPDPLGASFLHEVYRRADPHYSGRVTVPILWDKQAGTIVNNESSEIIRIFGSAFDSIGAAPGDLYPEALRDEIDTINARVYETLNNGVYRPASRPRRRLTTLPSSRFSRRSIGWKRDCRSSLISAVARRPRPTGASSRPWSASTPSITATSSVMSGASSTIRLSGTMPAAFTSGAGSVRPSISLTSRATITAVIATSTRPVSCRWAR